MLLSYFVGVIDFFKAVSTFAGEERVTFSNITNFLCQVKVLSELENLIETGVQKPNRS